MCPGRWRAAAADTKRTTSAAALLCERIRKGKLQPEGLSGLLHMVSDAKPTFPPRPFLCMCSRNRCELLALGRRADPRWLLWSLCTARMTKKMVSPLFAETVGCHRKISTLCTFCTLCENARFALLWFLELGSSWTWNSQVSFSEDFQISRLCPNKDRRANAEISIGFLHVALRLLCV